MARENRPELSVEKRRERCGELKSNRRVCGLAMNRLSFSSSSKQRSNKSRLCCSRCVPTDETEGLVDYEDKFPDTDGGVEQRAEEAKGEVQEEVHGAARTGWRPSQQRQETTFSLEQAHQDRRAEGGVAANGGEEREKAAGGFRGRPMSEREPGVPADAATEAPVSLLSQKHMFWFPSEAFQDEVTQRDSTVQSEESKEKESQEMNNSQRPVDPEDSRESDHHHHHDADDHDDHGSRHRERNARQHFGDRDDRPKPYAPGQHEVQDRLDRPRNQDSRDDHYDMGEHDEERSRGRYEDQENDDAYDEEHESYEDREDVAEDHSDDDQRHLDDSQEHLDHDDSEDRDGDEEHENQEEDDRDHYTDDHDDHDDLSDDHHDHDDHNEQHHHDDLSDDQDDHDDYDDRHHHDDDRDDLTDHTDDDGDDDNDQDDHHDSDDHGDHKDDDHDSYDDSHEDAKDRDGQVIFSITRDHHQNRTEMGDGGKTTAETWLDGYPVVATEVENKDSVVDQSKNEDTGAFNEVEGHKPVSHTSLPEDSKSSSKEAPLQQEGQEMWPGLIPTADPTLNSPRDHAAPTPSWTNDLTQQSFINPAPPVHDSDAVTEEHAMHNLPGESGERGEMEGEIGETTCAGENCPPPASAGQSSKVASIVVVVCLVAIAVTVGVWCYRRQQQKSSAYEMNGKGQSQSGPAQQMEMQQKV